MKSVRFSDAQQRSDGVYDDSGPRCASASSAASSTAASHRPVASVASPSQLACVKRARYVEAQLIEAQFSMDLAAARQRRSKALEGAIDDAPREFDCGWSTGATRVVYAPCPTQFAYDNARNACTSISLVTAYNFLRCTPACAGKSVVSLALRPFRAASPSSAAGRDALAAALRAAVEAMNWDAVYSAGARLYTDSQRSATVSARREGPRGVRTTLQHAFEVFFHTDGAGSQRMKSEMSVREELAGSLDPDVYRRSFGYSEHEAASHGFMSLRTAVDRLYDAAANNGRDQRAAAIISVRGSSACLLLEACDETPLLNAPGTRVAWLADSHGGGAGAANGGFALLLAMRDRETLVQELRARYPAVNTKIALNDGGSGAASATTAYDADLFDPCSPLNAFDFTVFVPSASPAPASPSAAAAAQPADSARQPPAS